ncbi:MAG: 6,7-dimethyl-8-ribityllumazine synthase [Thermoanaerobaculia bacterium]
MHTGVPGQISIVADGLRFGIAASRFHGEIVERLIGGAREALAESGVPGNAIDLERVPGAWEPSFALDRMAATERWDGSLALGTLIRGETSHYRGDRPRLGGRDRRGFAPQAGADFVRRPDL